MKFEVGEFAIVVYAPAFPEYFGKITLILEINPKSQFPYRTDVPGIFGRGVWANDTHLRKLPPHEEPESITRREECEA